MSQQLTTIFQGVHPKPARDAVADYVRHGSWKVFAQPFAGRFGLCEVIARTAGSAENIWASDIGVYSNLLGYYLSGQDLRGLGFHVLSLELQFLEDFFDGGLTHLGAAMLVLKYAQLGSSRRHNYYYQSARHELVVNHKQYRRHMEEQFAQLGETLKGIHYRVLDYKDEVRQHIENPEALIVCDPPNYAGGYTRMFEARGVYTWKEPMVPEFKPDQFDELMQECEDAEATVLVMQYGDQPIYPGWQVVIACSLPRASTNKYWRIVGNRPLEPKVIRDAKPSGKPRFPAMVNSPVERSTKVRLLRVPRVEAEYYRDLFVHKLGSTGGEEYYLLLLDGRVGAVLSSMSVDWARRGFNWIRYQYVIKAENIAEPKMDKLLNELVYCRQARDELLEQSRSRSTAQFKDIDRFRSTNVSRSPHLYGEPKRAKIVEMKRMKEMPSNIPGRYERMDEESWLIVYEVQASDKTYHQVVTEWLQQEGRL